MEYTVENVSGVVKKFTVTVPVEEVEAAISAAISMYQRDLKLDGFRKGKVPAPVVEQRFGKDLAKEATQDLVNVHINQIVTETESQPLGGLEFDTLGEKDMLERGRVFEYTITFETFPEIDLPDYAKLSVEEEQPEVAEDEVDEVLTRIRTQLAEVKAVETPRKPQDGDVAVVSFKGFDEDGAPLKDIRAENFELTLGEGQALADFEALVKELDLGETKERAISFPEDFLNKDMAGKTIEFRVTLDELKEKQLPELTDELAQKAGGFENVEAMREAVRKSYLDSRKQLAKSQAQKTLLDDLLKQVEFDLPPSLVDSHIGRMFNELEGKLARQGKSLDSLDKTPEELREQFREEAEYLVRTELFLVAVARRESLAVTDQELDFFFRQQAARTGEDFNTLKQFHMQHNLTESVRNRLLADKAMELIYSRAEITEVPAKAPDAESDAE